MPRTKLPLRKPSSHLRELYANHVRVERKRDQIFNRAENTIFINGVIDGMFMVSAEEVAEALDEMDDSKPLKVSINSPGGYVYEAIAIHNMIAEWPEEVTTHVTSLAASAASLIFMVGDKRTMTDNSELMVHHPWTIALGNAQELRSAADHLDKTSEKLLQHYVRKSNLSSNQVIALLDGEDGEDGTYLDAQESLEAGFATEIIDTSRGAGDDESEDDESNFMPRMAMAKVKMI